MPRHRRRTRTLIPMLLRCVSCGFALLTAGGATAQTVSQSPLSVGGSVPGNLALVPSVEWPTINSMANLGDYDVSRVYVGYFDPHKCYEYSFSAVEEERHFYPTSRTMDRVCSAGVRWSGNYLNWAATQTIDPFRKALTGGYRARDTTTETWLEKARYDGNGSNAIYPDRRIPSTDSDSSLVQGATPANWSALTTRIWRLGNRMRFTRDGDLGTTSPTAYDPAVHTTLDANAVYEVSVRVKVCDSSVGVESNCKQYSRGWKPEGLIQKYSDRIRYSVFGYLNDSDMLRDGGVLRARQKFVGSTKIDPVAGATSNPGQEWDPTTGVLIRNPEAADAAATSAVVGQTIADSGVINYLNKFGQMTSRNHKSHDPVSELYYTAIRYFKNLGNVPEYTDLSGTSGERYDLADGFPVIRDWDDPLQYWCQNNAILGIGDVNTHRDKNLPGNTRTADEPAMPPLVSADTTIDVVTATQKVAELEDIAIATPFTGRQNSAYIAGLAYDSHTKDMRPDLEGKQTVSTHWVDVRENQVLAERARNQYWLAAKYGGFAVPDEFDPYTRSSALPSSWWHTSGDLLSTGDPRPDNFYVASEADKMVESLTRAFARIAAEGSGSASSLASNTTRLDVDTKTYQAQFFSGTWRGELKAHTVSSGGALSSSPAWRASDRLAEATWSERRIYVHNPQGSGNNAYGLFIWANLGSRQTVALGSPEVVDYLRGDRSNEESQPNGTLRTRTGILGDIVNSAPVHVGRPSARLYAGASFTGARRYAQFVADHANRTPVVYVGANDGMLHGFNANDGRETYAFVPNSVIMNGLRQYAAPGYEHRYFVDGEMAVADVFDTSAGGSWKTILVGTLGRGGPGVFALDVTIPTNVKFLWEKSASDIPQLGKNIGKPIIAQVADGDWRVLIGNGPDSANGSAELVMIGIRTGTVTTVNAGFAGGNGLAAVLARDSNGDGFTDTAYAGDLQGNVWKFSDLAGDTAVLSLFEARDSTHAPQSITAAPLVGRNPADGTLWLFVGTGRYLGDADLGDEQVQSWYGVKDTGTSVARSDLLERRILAEGEIGDFAVRVIEEGSEADLVNAKGWYIDLRSPVSGAEGERMVVANRFQGRVLIGTTRIPDASDPCRPSGRGFVMAINPFTGGRLDETFFDVTTDGLFNESDKLSVDGVPVIVSGIGFPSSPNNPIFLEDVMQIGLDDGSTRSVKTQGSAVQAARMSWREILNWN